MPTDSSPIGHRRWLLILSLAAVLVAGIILAYQPVWRAGFIWDDDVYVTENRLLTAPDGWSRIWFSTDSPSQYFPLAYTVLRVERACWGLNASGYHWVNLLLHAASVLLLWRLLARLKIPGAWLGAALFAFHPVEVESVAWVTEIKNLLSLFFSLLALLSWVEFIEEERPGLWRFYFLCLLFYALALFSKTTACTLPAALILILWLQKKPLSLGHWLQMIPFLAGGVGMGLLTMWWERNHQNTVGEIFALGPLQRLL
ncbi:MAG TPA: glycosyltransferase family 39 protein, partial [Candidatus Saccharimonadales bacterium]|nr:glycosyltransferase family 39 protein [Candidatus Saccharimonadales bacterium]